MQVDVLAVLLIFGTVFVAVAGGILLAALKILKGGPKSSSRVAQPDEAHVVQELHKGLARMEERVEALEMLLLDKVERARPGSRGE